MLWIPSFENHERKKDQKATKQKREELNPVEEPNPEKEKSIKKKHKNDPKPTKQKRDEVDPVEGPNPENSHKKKHKE